MKAASNIKKILLVIVACLLLTGYGYSQSEYADSLYRELVDHPVDTAYVDILLDIAFWHRNSSPDSTIYYANEALQISKEIKYKDGEVLSTRNIGMGYEKKGNFDKALYICQEAMKLAEQYNLPGRIGDASNTIGLIYYQTGELEKAAKSFERSGKLFKEANRPSDAAGALANTGIILETKGDYTRALDFYQQSLLVFEELEHPEGIANAAHNIANIFKNENEFEKALEYYLRAAKIDSTTNNRSGFATTLTNIADVKLSLGDTAGCIAYHHKALAIYDEVGRKCRKSMSMSDLGDLYLSMSMLDSAYHYISQSYDIATACDNIEQQAASGIDFGKYYRAIDQPESAKKYLHESLDLAEIEDMKPLQADVAELLYLTYKAQNNLRQALNFLEIQKKLENEIFNTENTRKIAQLEAEYTLEKEKQQFDYEKQLSEMEYQKQLAHEQLIQRIFLIAILVFIALLVIILRLYFQKSKINKEIKEQNIQILEQNEEIRQQRDLLEERSNIVEAQKRDLLIANEELQDLNKEKNTIIGIVAHDLKSPINQIIGLIELIKLEDFTPPEEVKDYLSKMKTSSKRSLEMIDRMLGINAIENKEIDIKKESVEVSAFLSELVGKFEPEAKKKKIDLRLDYKNGQAKIETDPLLLNELLSNLVSNAIKFSNPESKVNLGLESSENLYKIYVKDQGPGISKQDQQLMYNKYQRVSANPTANEKSTGLGLAIVKRYTEALRYHLICDSTSGRGTTFTVEIPR